MERKVLFGNSLFLFDRMIQSSHVFTSLLDRILSHPAQLVASILFVDKVAGVPVSSTIDNYYENMMSQVQQILPRNSPSLHLGSRLDVCTSGEIICECIHSVRCTYGLALIFPSRLTTATYLTDMSNDHSYCNLIFITTTICNR